MLRLTGKLIKHLYPKLVLFYIGFLCLFMRRITVSRTGYASDAHAPVTTWSRAIFRGGSVPNTNSSSFYNKAINTGRVKHNNTQSKASMYKYDSFQNVHTTRKIYNFSNNSSNMSFFNLLPNGNKSVVDRITDQLAYTVDNVTSNKLILLVNYLPEGARRRLATENCAVTSCTFTNQIQEAHLADAILFGGMFIAPTFRKSRRPQHQIWIVSNLEAPSYSTVMLEADDLVNWTATYRRDSTIVSPYEKFVKYPTDRQIKMSLDYMRHKSKMVAWFVSNCHTKNGRMTYAMELRKYIELDIYGECGAKKCSRKFSDRCFKMLRNDYMFYLAFENSNCKDYITEKLYWNAYRNNVIPVVMGAHPDDYEAVAPPHSYIHVDHFTSPAHLAEYLQQVANNRTLYNTYFTWKGQGEFVNTKFWCRLCSMVHGAHNAPTWYSDVKKWWADPATCVKAKQNKWASWRPVTNSDPYLQLPAHILNNTSV